MTPAERIPVIGLSQDLSELLRSHYAGALFCVAFASAASIIFSIAVSQILLGIGLLLIVLGQVMPGRPRLFFPPIKLPLALFFARDDYCRSPVRASAWPAFRRSASSSCSASWCSSRALSGMQRNLRNLLVAWVGIAVFSAADGFVHVFARRQEALRLKWNTYDYFLDDRITGFASHWMTFGAEQMIVLLMLISFLLFACPRGWRALGW